MDAEFMILRNSSIMLETMRLRRSSREQQQAAGHQHQ
jgi:hypothetical protein